jgi:hypothetical protein
MNGQLTGAGCGQERQSQRRDRGGRGRDHYRRQQLVGAALDDAVPAGVHQRGKQHYVNRVRRHPSDAAADEGARETACDPGDDCTGAHAAALAVSISASRTR